MQARCSWKSAILIIADRTLHLLIKARVASHTYDAHRKLAFSTLAHDTLGITPLAAGVVTTLRRSAKNSVRRLIYLMHGLTNPKSLQHSHSSQQKYKSSISYKNSFITLIFKFFSMERNLFLMSVFVGHKTLSVTFSLTSHIM